MKKYGKWIKGDFWRFSSEKMRVAFEKAGKGVEKPTAVEQKTKNNKVVAWRIVHKPITPGELD